MRTLKSNQMTQFRIGKPCKRCGDIRRYQCKGDRSGGCPTCARVYHNTPEWRAVSRCRQRAYSKRPEVKAAVRARRGVPEATHPCPEYCECCGAKEPGGRNGEFTRDHDHKTGIFRGWLCHACNLGLGKLGDNLAGLALATKYLTRSIEPV